MSKSLRRLLISAGVLILALSFHAQATAGSLGGCAFCDEVCHDSEELGIAKCTEECQEDAGPAECDWDPNPCEGDPEGPVLNVCNAIE